MVTFGRVAGAWVCHGNQLIPNIFLGSLLCEGFLMFLDVSWGTPKNLPHRVFKRTTYGRAPNFLAPNGSHIIKNDPIIFKSQFCYMFFFL
jgi:hypothetical protein